MVSSFFRFSSQSRDLKRLCLFHLFALLRKTFNERIIQLKTLESACEWNCSRRTISGKKKKNSRNDFCHEFKAVSTYHFPRTSLTAKDFRGSHQNLIDNFQKKEAAKLNASLGTLPSRGYVSDLN